MKSSFQNATFLDVRTPEEFAREHYPGAVNIPLNQVNLRLEEIKALPQPLIIYCLSGNRSGTATALLKQHGLEVANGGALQDLLKSSAAKAS